jgi:hypothetical protein
MAEYLSYPGLLAGSSFASLQYHVCKLASTAGEVVPAAAKTDELMGVVQNDPADGEAAEIAIFGYCKAVASTGITAGSWLTVDTTGRVVAASTNGTGIVGYAPIAAVNAGDIIEIVVNGLTWMSA